MANINRSVIQVDSLKLPVAGVCTKLLIVTYCSILRQCVKFSVKVVKYSLWVLSLKMHIHMHTHIHIMSNNIERQGPLQNLPYNNYASARFIDYRGH